MCVDSNSANVAGTGNKPKIRVMFEELLGSEPVTIAEANERLIASDGLGIGYFDIEVAAAEFSSVIEIDAEQGTVAIKKNGGKAQLQTEEQEPKEQKEAEDQKDKPTISGLTKSEQNLIREKLIAKVNPSVVKEGYAYLTDKSVLSILRDSHFLDMVTARGYGDMRELMSLLMADYEYGVVMRDTINGPAERIKFKMPETAEKEAPVAIKTEEKAARNKVAEPTTSTGATDTPKVTSEPAASAKQISRYMLNHFAYLEKGFKGLATEVAERATGDDWFVIEEQGDRPMRLVESKLGLNFALAVREILAGRPSALTVSFDKASFDTGFVTAEGKRLVAHFVTNTERSNERFQSWLYTNLSEE